MSSTNHLGQPIGEALPSDWTAPQPPSKVTLKGRFVHVVPLDVEAHGQQLYQAFQLDETGSGWTYANHGPYHEIEPLLTWLQQAPNSPDALFFAYLDAQTGQAIGYGSLMRIDPAMGCIEVGNIRMSPLLQRTAMSTEAMHLKAEYVFGLGYRRYEWKCDSLNGPSRSAATRLGFTFEGIFRQAMHYKGRNRDTAWLSITDEEWPRIRQAHKAWLHPNNFDEMGQQKEQLGTFMALTRASD